MKNLCEVIIKQLKSSYDGNFKQNLWEHMHDNYLSVTLIAYLFSLVGAEVVLRLERIYYEEVSQELYIERRER